MIIIYFLLGLDLRDLRITRRDLRDLRTTRRDLRITRRDLRDFRFTRRDLYFLLLFFEPPSARPSFTRLFLFAFPIHLQ